MKPLLVALTFFVSLSALARDFTFAWDSPGYASPSNLARVFSWNPASVKMTLNAQNPSYNQSDNSYEVRAQAGTTPVVSNTFPSGSSSGTITLPVVSGGTITASVRALASASWVCDRTGTPDCDKSAWISLPNQSASDPNAGYDANKFYYEFRTKLNQAVWDTTTTQPGALTLTKPIAVVPNDQLTVQIRTRAQSDYQCDRVGTPDCDKSAWVSFPSLPTIDTPIVYPVTPTAVTIVYPGSSESGGTGLPIQFAFQSNIGSPTPSGSITENQNIYTLKSGGGDLWGTSDSFFMASNSTTLTSKTLVAKLISFPDSNTAAFSKAGIQIRFGTAANAKNVSVVVDKSNNVNLQWRDTTAGTTQEKTVSGITLPIWLKLAKVNRTFTGSFSQDGTTWTTIGTASVTMTGTINSGLVGAKNSTSTGPIIATFSQLQGF